MDMKYFKLLIVCLFSTFMISGCGGKKSGTPEVDSDTVSAADLVVKDKTLYGICGEATAMNTLQLITDNGDTLNISIEHARDNNMVFGGLEAMNKMAVLLAPDSSAPRTMSSIAKPNSLLNKGLPAVSAIRGKSRAKSTRPSIIVSPNSSLAAPSLNPGDSW